MEILWQNKEIKIDGWIASWLAKEGRKEGKEKTKREEEGI